MFSIFKSLLTNVTAGTVNTDVRCKMKYSRLHNIITQGQKAKAGGLAYLR